MSLSQKQKKSLFMALPSLVVLTSPIWFNVLIAYLRNRPLPPTPLPTTPAQFPFAELGSLDRVVQARFAVVPDKDFGAARIGPRHEYFRPLSPEEKRAIAALQKANKTVVFYVVGRNFLPTVRGVTDPTTVQGPIYFTPGSKLSVSATKEEPYSTHSTRFLTPFIPRHDLPSQDELVRAALPVFAHADIQNSASSRIGSWQVTSVPVRATDMACVRCHNNVPVSHPRDHSVSFSDGWLNPRNADRVALNQPLGIAMYCVQDAKR